MADKSSDVPQLPNPTPSEPKKETRVDPDKFKQIMEVQESDDTQQRNKRNRPLTEEEVEDEDEEEANLPSPDLFRSKMQDSEVPDIQPSDTSVSPPSEEDLPDVTPSRETPYSLMTKGRDDTKGDIYQEPTDQSQPTEDRAQKSDASPKDDSIQQPEEAKKKTTLSHKPRPSAKTPSDATLAEMAEAESFQEEEHLKEAKAPKASEKHGKKSKKTVPEDLIDEIDLVAPAPLTPLAADELEALEEEKEKIAAEKHALETSINPHPLSPDLEQPDSKKKEEEEKKEQEDATPAPQVMQDPIMTYEATPPPHIFSLLHPKVYELFEKLVGILMIEKDKHQTVVTVTIHKENSLFNNSQILIQSYPTAPKQFHIQLQGSPEAVSLFQDHMENLNEAFQLSQLPFQVYLQRPILLTEEKTTTRRTQGTQQEKRDKDDDSQNSGK